MRRNAYLLGFNDLFLAFNASLIFLRVSSEAGPRTVFCEPLEVEVEVEVRLS